MDEDKWIPRSELAVPKKQTQVPGQSKKSEEEKYEAITNGSKDHVESVPNPSEIYENWQHGVPSGHQGVPGYGGYSYPFQTDSNAIYPWHLIQHPESQPPEDKQQRQTEREAYVQHQQVMPPHLGQFPNFNYPYTPYIGPPPPYEEALHTNRPVRNEKSEISRTLGQQELSGRDIYNPPQQINPPGFNPDQMPSHPHYQQRIPSPLYQSKDEQVHSGHNISKKGKEEKKLKSQEKETEIAKPPMKLKVTKIPSSVSEDTVGYFFENKRRSGGGDIDEIQYNQKKGMAIITFVDPGGLNLLQIMQKVPLSLGGKEIHIERSVDDEQIQTNSNIIQVQGMKETTPNDTLESYFESKRAAGAFVDIANFEMQEEDGNRIVYITYKHRKDMEQVLQRKHTLDGATLSVKEYKVIPWYDDKILIKGVDPVTTEDGLRNFLEAKSGATPCEFLYGEEDGATLVTFDESPDFEKLQEACKKRCLDGAFLHIQRVRMSNCIVVYGIGKNTGEDTVRYYFENNRRSGGGDITKLKFEQSDGFYLIWFENPEVTADVCKRKHVIDGTSLSVLLYYEGLGQAMSKDELSQFKLPEPVTIETLDTRKLHFLLNSKINSRAIEAQLQSLHAKIHWPDTPSGPVVLDCVLTKDSKDSIRMAVTWRNKVLGVLNNYLDALGVERHEVPQAVWSIALQELQKIKFSNQPDGMTLIFEKSTMEIFVVGHKQFVKTSSQNVEEIIQQAVKDEKKVDKPVEEKLTIQHHEILILSFLQFKGKMENKYNLSVILNIANSQVIFRGYAAKVLTAKQEMLSIIENIPKAKLTDFSYKKYKFLQNSQIKKYITKKLKVDQFVGIWDYEENAFKIFATNDNVVAAAARTLREILIEINFDITEESHWALSSDSWRDIQEKAKSTSFNNIEFHFDSKSARLTVLCTDIDCRSLKELLQTFWANNAVTQEMLDIPDSIVRYINQQMMTDIKNIEETLHGDHVIIECKTNQIVIRGTRNGIQKARTDIDQLCQKIEKKVHILKDPGVSKLMESDMVRDKIAMVEREKGVTISCGEDSEEWKRKGGNSSSLREVALCETGRYNIYCVLGDITKLGTDAVVNTANKDLKHIGGLSKVLVKAGGRCIQEECTAHVKKVGKILEGEVFCSGAGSLPCKMLVHAVTRTWQDGENQEKELLKEAVLNCLKETGDRGMTSIAFPAIGTGALGIPGRIATSVIIAAIDEFFDDAYDAVITDVYLCDVKEENVTLFLEELKSIFGSHRVSLTNNPVDVQRKASRHNEGRPCIYDEDTSMQNFLQTINSIWVFFPVFVLLTLELLLTFLRGDITTKE